MASDLWQVTWEIAYVARTKSKGGATLARPISYPNNRSAGQKIARLETAVRARTLPVAAFAVRFVYLAALGCITETCVQRCAES